MSDYSKNNVNKADTDQIDKIAVCLSDNFVKPLFDLQPDKKYSAYVKCLAEILNWSHEFYSQHHHILSEWEVFAKSKENVYNAATWNDFLIAWGQKRINQLYSQNMNEKDHSRKRTQIERIQMIL